MEYRLTLVCTASVGRPDAVLSNHLQNYVAGGNNLRVTRTQSLALWFCWRGMIVERVGQNVRKVARYLSLAFMFYWRVMIVERVGQNIEKVERSLKSYWILKPERRDTFNEYYSFTRYKISI